MSGFTLICNDVLTPQLVVSNAYNQCRINNPNYSWNASNVDDIYTPIHYNSVAIGCWYTVCPALFTLN